MQISRKVLLFTIFLLGFLLRIYRIDSIPISLNRDEVGLGYDTFSLAKTGKDQYGTFLPLTLRSSDDYKPAIYSYVDISSILLFGENEFGVRFPSVLAGSIIIILVFFLVKELFRDHSTFTPFESERMAFLSAFILSISPWHIQFSRGAYEVNLSLLFFTIGVLFLYRLLKRQSVSLLSGFFFGLAILTYHSMRFMVPLVLIYFFFLFHKEISKRAIAIVVVLVGLFSLLALPSILSRQAQIRFEVLNIFVTDTPTNRTYLKESAEAITHDSSLSAELSGKLVHNRRIATFRYETVQIFFHNALSYLFPQFLLVGEPHGSRAENHAPSYGLMHGWEYTAFIIGTLLYLIKNLNRKTNIILLWFLTGLIPAALSWDSPNSWRSLVIIIPCTIMSSLTLLTGYRMLSNESKVFAKICLAPFTLVISFSLFIFLHQYFIHLNRESSEEWRYGRKEAVYYTESIKMKYNKIIVSTELDDPHLYFLFYSHYDPRLYLREGGTISGGWTANQNHFDRYEFKRFQYDTMSSNNILLVGKSNEFSQSVIPIHTIKYLNGDPAITFVEK